MSGGTPINPAVIQRMEECLMKKADVTRYNLTSAGWHVRYLLKCHCMDCSSL